jgi:hypothetical protein
MYLFILYAKKVLCLQPFNYAKNMTQQGLKIHLNPAIMYRGVAANSINMGSCTMIQFVIGGKLKQTLLGDDTHRRLSLSEQMLCGVGAGTMSAFVGSPLELVMIQQQRHGTSTMATIKTIASPSMITRGFTGMAIREALWTCGYLSIPPVVRTTLMESYPEQFPDANRARVPAALLGGLFACYLTQPFDTVKTCMQGDIERKVYGTFRQTASIIWSQNKIYGFYRGATFRYGRMVCAVFIMDYMKDFVSEWMFPEAFK